MGVESLSLMTVATRQRIASRADVTRTPLSEALALGPAAWDAVLERAESPSPFMTWAWHRAWADAAPPAELAASDVLVVRGAGGSVEALLPIGYRRVSFHRVPVAALTWAIGEVGCPDHLDVAAGPTTDVAALVPVLEALPWQVLTLSNLASNAVTARRLCEAFAARGGRERMGIGGACASWSACCAG